MNKAFVGNDIKREQSAEELGLALAERLKSPQEVKGTVTSPTNLTMEGHSPWGDFSLASGYPSMIMLFSTLDRKYPENEWDVIAHNYIIALKNSLEQKGISSPSLFGGLGGIAYSIFAASRDGQRYSKFLKTINTLLLQETKKMLRDVDFFIEKGQGVPSVSYDVIAGLVGIGRYLLETRDIEEHQTLLLDILNVLCKLSTPIVINREVVPGWYISREHQFNDKYRNRYPEGNFNIGVSHGVSGILALFSLCLERGIKVPKMYSVMNQIIDCLLFFKQEDEDGIYWPGIISFYEFTNQSPKNVRIADTWCYGSTGIGRVLFLAGRSTGREELKELAQRVYYSIYSDRTMRQRNLSGSSFCHGTAGLMYLTQKMGIETRDDYLVHESNKVFDQLKTQFDKGTSFGYSDSESKLTINKPGLLEGTAGIALALLTAQDNRKYHWEQLFLMD